jgi:LEA14-like dessication related protein
MLVAAMLVAGATAGCATLGRQVFKEPVVQLSDVRLVAVGMTGGTIDVLLNVYNPNEFRLDATRLTYRLLVDSVQVGQGALDSRFTVQQGDSTLVRLPVSFTYSGLGAVANQLRNQGMLNYRVMGDVTVTTPLGDFTRPYDQQGRYTIMGGDTY